jgi:hypothetical protein
MGLYDRPAGRKRLNDTDPSDLSRRAQARLRQARKRQRGREERLDLETEVRAMRVPEAWRSEWKERVQRHRERKARAAIEVEKVLPLIPDSGRREFVKRNRPHTKVSLAEFQNHFVREMAWREHLEQREREFVAAQYEEVGGVPEDGIPFGGWNTRYPGSPPLWLVQKLERLPRQGPIDQKLIKIQRAARFGVSPCNHVNIRHPSAPKTRKVSIFFCRA